MSFEKEDLIAVMVAALVGPKIPAECEASWEQRVDDAIARAERIWKRIV